MPEFVYRLMVPMGIVFYLLILLAVLTGLRVIRVKLAVHRLLALIGAGGGLIHALIGAYITYAR
jgi:NADH:ubiquinone oxidoreductase subunit 6 (subunit J)